MKLNQANNRYYFYFTWFMQQVGFGLWGKI
jgi:hypothetical protein